MISRITRYSLMLLGLLFVLAAFQSRPLWAQDHVVTSADLQKDVNQAAQVRQSREAKLEAFLSTPEAKKALRAANVDYKTVQKGVPMLSDAELARLAARADKAQADFAAGSLSNQDLTYIVIALATAVIVLIIVYH
ncbi:MAG TPA: hypothetical protein VLY23_18740 [Candidatus Acidoferrum sp.]|nr:hypothetical protein [Candidatus Acidoferrum sp.]